jgi:hypothetical protein
MSVSSEPLAPQLAHQRLVELTRLAFSSAVSVRTRFALITSVSPPAMSSGLDAAFTPSSWPQSP